MGKKVGPSVRKAKWLWYSITSTKAEAIRAEYAVGQDLANEVRNRVGLDVRPEVKRILEEVGSCLSGCVAEKMLKFNFEAVESEKPNAFALPGGFIFVSRSMLDLCDYDKSELAFILGHEMGHVIRGHAIQKVVSNSAIAIGAGVVPARGVLAGWLRKVGIQFFQSAYSQDIELEADKLGVRLVVAAGYDGAAAIQFLSRLNSRSEKQSALSRYFSSHPPFQLRINEINSLLVGS
ncbi:M48 family metallopeptidase [Planctomycetota bacterium]